MMTLVKVMELENELLRWYKDTDCSQMQDCKGCPFDKNDICERLQEICKELKRGKNNGR